MDSILGFLSFLLIELPARFMDAAPGLQAIIIGAVVLLILLLLLRLRRRRRKKR